MAFPPGVVTNFSTMSKYRNHSDGSTISNGQETRFATIASNGRDYLHEQRPNGGIHWVCMIEPPYVDAWIKQLCAAKQVAEGGDQ